MYTRGFNTVPNQPLNSTPITQLYNLTNPFNEKCAEISVGGTDISTYSDGDVLIGAEDQKLQKLPIGSAKQVLTWSDDLYWSDDFNNFNDSNQRISDLNENIKRLLLQYSQLKQSIEENVVKNKKVMTQLMKSVNEFHTSLLSQKDLLHTLTNNINLKLTDLEKIDSLRSTYDSVCDKDIQISNQYNSLLLQLTRINNKLEAVYENSNILVNSLMQKNMYFKNYIINGSFKVWQNSEDVVSTNAPFQNQILTADNWMYTSNVKVSSCKVSDGDFICLSTSSQSSGVVSVSTTFDKVSKGTLSFYIKGNTDITLDNIIVGQDIFQIKVSKEWSRVFFPIKESKYLSIGNKTSAIWDKVLIANVQAEEGELSDFEERFYAQELLFCTRTLEKGVSHFTGYSIAGSVDIVVVHFKTPKLSASYTISTKLINKIGYSSNITVVKKMESGMILGVQKSTTGVGYFTIDWRVQSTL